MMKHVLQRSVLLSLIGFSSLSVFAGGFQLSEENTSGLGNAYAGASALPEDASIGFWNPAGLTYLKQKQVVASGAVINLNNDVRIPEASNIQILSPMPTPAPTQGNNREEAGGWFFVPAMHFSLPFYCDKMAVGIGVTAPFGLTTSYSSSSRSRYLATHSNLTTINIGPSVAYQVNRHLSIGGGVDFQYLTVTLKQKLPTVAGDAEFKNEANDWGYGWNIGAMCCFDTGTTLGASYRSRIHHELSGDAYVRGPAALGAFNNEGGVSGRITLPDYGSVSLVQRINDQWAFLASYFYTNWETIDKVTLDYTEGMKNVNFPDGVALDLDFQGASKVALALNYCPNECWKLRLGTAYDQTNVRRPTTRSFRLADNDRVWLALGAQYKVNRCVKIDLAYAHLFVKEAKIHAVSEVASANAQVEGSVNQFGGQLTWNL